MTFTIEACIRPIARAGNSSNQIPPWRDLFVLFSLDDVFEVLRRLPGFVEGVVGRHEGEADDVGHGQVGDDAVFLGHLQMAGIARISGRRPPIAELAYERPRRLDWRFGRRVVAFRMSASDSASTHA
jgi:hypothetical protein